MNDLTTAAARLAEELEVSYLVVLDSLAAVGLTLAVDEECEASRAYIEACELEGMVA